jgi:hypothetical protein
MQTLALGLASALLLAVGPGVAKNKHKYKEKTFEPRVFAHVHEYVGHYVGIEAQFWADVSVGSQGDLQVDLYEKAERVRLEDVVLNGARLEGTKIDADGQRQPFEAVFGDRVVNGVRRYGLLVEGQVHFDADVVFDRLFYWREKAPPPAAP